MELVHWHLDRNCCRRSNCRMDNEILTPFCKG
jgi:hypothetical protein